MTDPRQELVTVLERLRRGHDVAPCLATVHATRDMAFWRLPTNMLRAPHGATDRGDPAPGAGPLWLRFRSGDDHAALVLYRAEADGQLYVLAPG